MTTELSIDPLKLDALFAPFDRSDSPGVAVGVAYRGVPVYRRGFGLANVELPVVLTPQTRMRIGSTTKHFCALLVMLLAEEGKLSPDDSVRKHIPELGAWADKVTLAHLMSHTSGSRCSAELVMMMGGLAGGAPEESLIEMMLGVGDVNFAPGEGWSYCNGGYSLLTEIVQRQYGRKFEDVLKDRILTPVGMHNTMGRPLDTSCVPYSAASHLPDGQGGWKKGLQLFAFHGEGNMISTVDDMLLWLKHMSAPTVGSAQTWAQMRTPVRLNNGAPTGYGFGLMMGEYRGVPIVSHGGGVAGGSNQMLKVLGHDLDIVIMTNMAGPANTATLTNDIIDLVIPGLAPLPEPSGPVTPVTGEFFSSRTGRYVKLAALEGQQALLFGPMKLPLQRQSDGSFQTPMATNFKLRISEAEVGWDEFETVDPLARLGQPTASETPAIAGSYEVPDIGGTARVVSGEPALLSFSSRYGKSQFALEQRGPGLWIGASTDPTNPISGIPVQRDGNDLLLSSGRTRHLRLRRVG